MRPRVWTTAARRSRCAVVLVAALAVGGCAALVPPPPQRSPGHLQAEGEAAPAAIPEVVERTPWVPPPAAVPATDTYTVVVDDVPVRELLFALARDAKINIDVAPGVEGNVTLNAVEQTLEQILSRLARQVALRYHMDDGTLVIEPDRPYYRTYHVDFVNMARDTTKTVTVATQIETGGEVDTGAGGGSGGGPGNNNSTTRIESTSNNRLWETLYFSIMALLGHEDEARQGGGRNASQYVIPNPEAGLLTVLATERQHREVQALLDRALTAAKRQVLIEATIVEVKLTDRYQAGIDWSRLAANAGLSIQQSVLGGNLGQAPFFLLRYADPDTEDGAVDVTVRALREFGDVQVLSSPKVMVLNNQTALLKVVDNEVYFTIDVETTSTQGVINTTFDTTPHTVPVGFVMSVTPGVYADDTVMLNVRPTISRIARTVNDPNPALANAGVTSAIPVIETRELESLLRVVSGQTAVLGGLMQDDFNTDSDAVPLLSRIAPISELFRRRDNRYVKTELVVFLRPTVIRAPSLEGDFARFRPLLEPPLPVAGDAAGGR